MSFMTLPDKPKIFDVNHTGKNKGKRIQGLNEIYEPEDEITPLAKVRFYLSPDLREHSR